MRKSRKTALGGRAGFDNVKRHIELVVSMLTMLSHIPHCRSAIVNKKYSATRSTHPSTLRNRSYFQARSIYRPFSVTPHTNAQTGSSAEAIGMQPPDPIVTLRRASSFYMKSLKIFHVISGKAMLRYSLLD